MKTLQQVRRPLVAVALSVVTGLYLQCVLNLSPLLLLALSAFLLSAAIRFVRYRQLAVCSACAVLAASYGAIEAMHVPAAASLPVAEIQSRQQEVVGTVTDDPWVSAEDGTITFGLNVEAVWFEKGWMPAESSVRVRMKKPSMPVAYGERWRLSGPCRSYNSIYSGVYGSLYTSGEHAIRIQKSPLSLKGICYTLRRRAARVFGADMCSSPEHTQLLQALLLGYRNSLPTDLYHTFSRTGTLHIFAISGLHVGVMAAILIAGLKLAGISKPKWGLVLIPLLFFYVVSTGMKPSAFRAFTMASVYFAAPLFRRRPDSVSAIALSALILLLINPLQLGDPGFLLSFTVVSGIVMVHHYVARRLNGFACPSWAVPLAQFNGPRPALAAARTVGLLALTSVAAWVFSIPLTAAFFHTLSPAALFANLAIIPLTFMIVLTGCLSLLSAPVWWSATLLFNDANRVFISALLGVIRGVEALPGSYLFVSSPPPTALAFWYFGLLLIFVAPKRCGRAGAPFLLLAMLAWLAASLPNRAGIQTANEVDAAVLIHGGLSGPILVTHGDAYSVSRATQRLQKEGINRLPVLAVHGAQMDVDAVNELCETFSVRRVWMSPILKRNAGALRCAEVSFSAHPQWTAGRGTISVDLN